MLPLILSLSKDRARLLESTTGFGHVQTIIKEGTMDRMLNRRGITAFLLVFFNDDLLMLRMGPGFFIEKMLFLYL